MRSHSACFAPPVCSRDSGPELLPGGMIAQGEDGRRRKGPLARGLAEVGAGAAGAVTVRCRGTRAHTTAGGKRLAARAAVAVVACVGQHETGHLADAWDGLQQLQGVGVMRAGGFGEGQSHGAEPLVVVVEQGQVDGAPRLPSGLGTPRRAPMAVRLLGELLADLGQVIPALGRLAVG
jgi:hypothetical protein